MTDRISSLELDNKEGEIPVFGERKESTEGVTESSILGLMLKEGDKLLPRLNMNGKPIVNKYCEGKMKRTLKKELKDLKPLRRKR